MTNHRKAKALYEKVGSIFDKFPEEIGEAPACYPYRAAVSELEELYELLDDEPNPEEMVEYRADIRQVVRRASRARASCVLYLKKRGQSMIDAAETLPHVSNEFSAKD